MESVDQFAVGITATVALFQFVTAYLMVRLGRLVGYKRLWIVASAGLTIMACYSLLELSFLLSGTDEHGEGVEKVFEMIGVAALMIGLAAMEGPLRRTQAVQAQMREHQARLDLLVDQLPGQLWTTDIDGRITYIRGRGLEAMGFSPSELEGRSIGEIFGTEGLAAEAMATHQAAMAGPTVPFTTRFRGRSWEGAVAPVFGDGGHAVGMVGVSVDTTVREKAAEEALANEQRLNAILDNAPALVFIKGIDDRILHVNRRCEDVLGMARAEALGKRMDELLPPELSAAYAVNDRLVLERGEAMTFIENAERDGRSISFLSIKFPLRDAAGGIYGLCGICTDITDRIEMEQELRRGRTLLGEAQEMARLGNWDWDIVSGRRYWSPELYRLLGHDPEAGLPPTLESYAEHVPEEDRGALMQKANRAHLHGRPYAVEHRMIRADGTMIWVLAKGRLERDDDGTPVRMYGLIQDITDAKVAAGEIAALNTRLEDRVRQRTVQLEDALKQLGSFTYAVSHDLRQPLRAIAGRLAMLQEDDTSTLSPEAAEHVVRVQQAALRMDALIADLLALSRVSYGTLRRVSIDLSTLAREVAADVAASEPERHVEWNVADGMEVFADRGLVRIAIENLLGNAFKFTRRCEVAHIDVCMEQTGGEVVYCVRDDGIGFDEAHAVHLFEPFQRLHETEEFEGTGVGLATVARIIGRHGGWIRASATPGKGTTIRFTLPQVTEPEPAPDVQGQA